MNKPIIPDSLVFCCACLYLAFIVGVLGIGAIYLTIRLVPPPARTAVAETEIDVLFNASSPSNPLICVFAAPEYARNLSTFAVLKSSLCQVVVVKNIVEITGKLTGFREISLVPPPARTAVAETEIDVLFNASSPSNPLICVFAAPEYARNLSAFAVLKPSLCQVVVVKNIVEITGKLTGFREISYLLNKMMMELSRFGITPHVSFEDANFGVMTPQATSDLRQAAGYYVKLQPNATPSTVQSLLRVSYIFFYF
ncbi:hypothetical protein ISCGN_021859 [Ixodes scapularis]